jgi:hypothetical protein
MNEQEIQQNIATYYSKLSPKLQETFASMKWLETLKLISLKYGLSEEQIQVLGTETTLTLLGMSDLGEYERMLKRELKLPKDLLEKIIEEINTAVINAVRPDLMKAFEINIKTEENEERKKVLDERFEKLPKEIQNAILESNYYEILYEIGGKYGLLISQIVELEVITTNIMLGIIQGGDFEETVKNKFKLPEEKTRGLVYEITERILKKIREKMEKIYYNKSESFVPTAEINKVLNTAGIKIIKSVPTPNTQTEEKTENRENILEGIEKPDILSEEKNMPVPEKLEIASGEKTQPIFAQKLSTPVQSQTVKTEHTLENISKTEILSTPSTNTEKPKIDPYREIPE